MSYYKLTDICKKKHLHIVSDPAQISELLSKTIADAHARTCLYSLEHIHNMFRKPQDLSKILYYKNMVRFSCAHLYVHIDMLVCKHIQVISGTHSYNVSINS